jgi:hypothetical protein
MCSYLVFAFKMLIFFYVTKASLANVMLNHTMIVMIILPG